MNTAEIKRENFINLYNEKGEKHGVWEDYFDNGKLRYRRNFVNGKKQGAWEHYYGNGQLLYRANFVDGKKHGVRESYYYNGELCHRTEYNMGEEVQPIIELTLNEIAEKFNIPVNQLKIKTQ